MVRAIDRKNSDMSKQRANLQSVSLFQLSRSYRVILTGLMYWSYIFVAQTLGPYSKSSAVSIWYKWYKWPQHWYVFHTRGSVLNLIEYLIHFVSVRPLLIEWERSNKKITREVSLPVLLNVPWVQFNFADTDIMMSNITGEIPRQQEIPRTV